MVPSRSSPVWLPDSSSLPFQCIVHYLNPFGRKQHTPVCNLFLQSDCERPTLICIAVTNVTAIPRSHGTQQGASIVRRNLNMEAFLQLVFKIPSLDKQREIGYAISLLKYQLKTANKIIRAYISQKKYLLRQMFI